MMNAERFVPLGYEQLTGFAASKALQAIPAGATHAVISPEAQAVRYRDDGTAPTTTVGIPIAVNEVITYSGRLSALLFIEIVATAKLNVLYYRTAG